MVFGFGPGIGDGRQVWGREGRRKVGAQEVGYASTFEEVDDGSQTNKKTQ